MCRKNAGNSLEANDPLIKLMNQTNSSEENKGRTRNLVAFWLFGICNNFAYCLMNSAAQDILEKHSTNVSTAREQCEEVLLHRHCSPHSASLVLFCNILPGLIIKMIYPFIAPQISYGIRHVVTCLLLAASLIIVAWADTVPLALVGVMIGAVQCGLGEATYLGLSSHYSKNTISTWSAGTGMAGVAGAFSYAVLTDPQILGFSSSQAMLISLIVPFTFLITYYFVLEQPEKIQQEELVMESKDSLESDSHSKSLQERIEIIKILAKYMIPLFLVYFAEYLINQGLAELVIFDCAHGFGTSLRAQYKWYQVGVLISRCSVNLIQFNVTWCAILAALQCLNTVLFFFDSIYAFVPHLAIVAVIILYEGLIGGAAYVNIYSNVDSSIREFAFSVVTVADTAGIVVASLAAMPIHNSICDIPF